MDRRAFVTASLAAGSVSLVGRMGSPPELTTTRGDATVHTDRPAYSDWIPTANHFDTGTGVVFTHHDRETLSELEALLDGSATESIPGSTDQWTANVNESPILAMPLAGTRVTPLTLAWISRYPFAPDLFESMEGDPVASGIRPHTTTWTGTLFVFLGEYDPAVFGERYSEGFEATADRDGYTVYVGVEDSTAEMAYAVSTDALIVELHDIEDEGGDTGGSDVVVEGEVASDDDAAGTVVADAIERNIAGRDRVIDEQDGRWLFEATGEAPLAVGGWKRTDQLGALQAPEGDSADGTTEDPRGTVPASDDFTDYRDDDADESDLAEVESFVNTIAQSDPDGAVYELDARFAAIYPEDAVPSKDAVREHLIGVSAVAHEIEIDGTRVYATATFELVSGTRV